MARYWCKSCEIFVDDNKISRKQHDLSDRHKNSIQKAINDLHRQNRQEDRAAREADKLIGIHRKPEKASKTQTSLATGEQGEVPEPQIGEWEEATRKPTLRTLGSPLQTPEETNTTFQPKQLNLPPSEMETKNWDFQSQKPMGDATLSDEEDGAKRPVAFKKRKTRK